MEMLGGMEEFQANKVKGCSQGTYEEVEQTNENARACMKKLKVFGGTNAEDSKRTSLEVWNSSGRKTFQNFLGFQNVKIMESFQCLHDLKEMWNVCRAQVELLC